MHLTGFLQRNGRKLTDIEDFRRMNSVFFCVCVRMEKYKLLCMISQITVCQSVVRLHPIVTPERFA